MSEPTPNSYYPDNGQGPYGTSNSSWPNNSGVPPYADPTYPDSGSQGYSQPYPNTVYAGESYYPPSSQQMYPPPPPVQPAYVPFGGYGSQQANGPGIASLVLGIIGVITFWFPFVGFIISLVGLVLASAGMKRLEGKGFAVAGLVLSIIGIVLAGCITASTIFAIIHRPYYP